MSITKVEGFRTSDEKFFDKSHRHEAQIHEAGLQLLDWADEHGLCLAGDNWSIEMVVEVIMEDRDKVRSILNEADAHERVEMEKPDG